jgi:ribosomal protein L30E
MFKLGYVQVGSKPDVRSQRVSEGRVVILGKSQPAKNRNLSRLFFLHVYTYT